LNATYAVIWNIGNQRHSLEESVNLFNQQVRTAETAEMTNASLQLQKIGTTLTRIVTGGFVILGAPLTIAQLFPAQFGTREKLGLITLGSVSLLFLGLRHTNFRDAAKEILRTPEKIHLQMENLRKTAQVRRENEVDLIIARATVEPRTTHPRSRTAYKLLWPES
jgi:hypothetical protein